MSDSVRDPAPPAPPLFDNIITDGQSTDQRDLLIVRHEREFDPFNGPIIASAGDGDDIILGERLDPESVIFGGAGADLFIFEQGRSGAPELRDFDPAEGDVILFIGPDWEQFEVTDISDGPVNRLDQITVSVGDGGYVIQSSNIVSALENDAVLSREPFELTGFERTIGYPFYLADDYNEPLGLAQSRTVVSSATPVDGGNTSQSFFYALEGQGVRELDAGQGSDVVLVESQGGGTITLGNFPSTPGGFETINGVPVRFDPRPATPDFFSDLVIFTPAASGEFELGWVDPERDRIVLQGFDDLTSTIDVLNRSDGLSARTTRLELPGDLTLTGLIDLETIYLADANEVVETTTTPPSDDDDDLPPPSSDAAETSDTNADGTDDLIWRNADTRQVVVWEMDGGRAASFSQAGSVRNDWASEGVGDFTGDGTADILWRNVNSGQVVVWEMEDSRAEGYPAAGRAASNWSVVATGDFDGDGIDDVAWRNANNGAVAIWEMDDGVAVAYPRAGSVTSNWSVVATGDFDGDGTDDIAWRNANNGDVFVWDMDDGRAAGYPRAGSVTANWSVVGVGDFDGDGADDIAWRNANNGDVFVWDMDNGRAAGFTRAGNVSADWSAVGAGDYNGDGTDDIAWRNANLDRVVVWNMDTSRAESFQQAGRISDDWTSLNLDPDDPSI